MARSRQGGCRGGKDNNARVAADAAEARFSASTTFLESSCDNRCPGTLDCCGDAATGAQVPGSPIAAAGTAEGMQGVGSSVLSADSITLLVPTLPPSSGTMCGALRSNSREGNVGTLKRAIHQQRG